MRLCRMSRKVDAGGGEVKQHLGISRQLTGVSTVVKTRGMNFSLGKHLVEPALSWCVR